MSASLNKKAMSEGNQIQRAYEEKMHPFVEGLRRMPKKPITLSPKVAWVCIENGLDPSDAERLLTKAWAEGKLHKAYPPRLSAGAAKLLTQADLDRFFVSGETGPENVIANAIMFQNNVFRGSIHEHNEVLSEWAVQMAIDHRDRRRRRERKDRRLSNAKASASEGCVMCRHWDELR
jgi:hypothetical protein